MSFFQKLKEKISQKTEAVTGKFKDGLSKTRDAFVGKVEDLVKRYKKLDDDFFEELEEILISADVGVTTVLELVDELREEAKAQRITDAADLKPLISEKLVGLLQPTEHDYSLNVEDGRLNVIMFVGVNGVGKTTTIGKIAHMYKQQGKKVVLAAGDTFRAGAIEQLEVWGERVGADVIKHQEGSDPAAVIFDAIHAAKSRKADILLCDTAGRLQNKVNLMDELNKVYRVIQREIPDAPHETMLVLDATTGQNAMNQAKAFGEATDVSGIVLTKLDGTAKGGIVVAISNELKTPVKYVGLGEQMDDLQPFDAEQFVHALFTGFMEEPADESPQTDQI
ncbi:signal recognition particle-docking protein FtsY [Ammoniphilus oxalaticus]|uniref:Signal recognition particle receptor FtsY n=1 Tax=Ammoniphilus oxalaticus TaxID=66863 RepID=A0A419SJF3_9BACL|nr:signal recognition particle-docking protein FtsY [Ammoniphilus oxalaticus]RKD24174.1 signal recognition particle-docking protein FtsY [Ammoniphilus oxalaticus]